jgi:uncharacterized protein (DUF362 family)
MTHIVLCPGGRIPRDKLDALWRESAACARLREIGGREPLVLIKPNWLQEGREDRPDIWEPVITDPGLVCAMTDLVVSGLKKGGTVVLADAPHGYADFAKVVSRGGLDGQLDSLGRRAPNVTLELSDLRRETWRLRENVVVERRPNVPDARGYTRLDLGPESLLFGHRGEGRFYGADYDIGTVNKHHCGRIHEYLLSGTAMSCDVFINLPKLKTHKKTGITCALKNLVGINGDKNWLPHHTEGSPRDGGDEFPSESAARSIERTVKRWGRGAVLHLPGLGPWLYGKMRRTGLRVLGDSNATIRNGNWIGNDTCWRMALDLNRALLFGRSNGAMSDTRRAYFCVADGIVGGEGNGPLCPDPVAANLLLVGENPAEVDAACCRLMGFDPGKIPLVREAFAPHRWPLADRPLEDVTVFDERVGQELALADVRPAVPDGFKPHFGWADLNPAKAGD